MRFPRPQQALRSPLARLAPLALLLLATPAQAVMLAGFEGDLNGFTTVGDVYRLDTSFDANISQGSWAMFLSTFPNGGGIGSMTGHPMESPASPSVLGANVEALLGLAAGTLDALSPSGNPVTEGSAARLDFTVTTTATLSLEFNMYTNETTVWSPTWRDYVFTTLTGQLDTVQADVDASPLVASATVFDRETGFVTLTWANLAPGNYSLGIGVMDVEDDNVGTAILVDNVMLVPEPHILLLVGSGLGGMWLAGRPRRRR